MRKLQAKAHSGTIFILIAYRCDNFGQTLLFVCYAGLVGRSITDLGRKAFKRLHFPAFQFIFRHNILCLTCSLIHDPCFNDSEQWPSVLLTLKTGTELSPYPPAQLLKMFRRRRALTDQPVRLTIFREQKEAEEAALKFHQQDSEEANWEVLGRPHTSSVRFFETILPPQLPQGDTLPNHLFKAAVWHAIWSHANLNDNPTLIRLVKFSSSCSSADYAHFNGIESSSSYHRQFTCSH